MQKRKYEVHGIDQNNDLWIVASDLEETAKSIAEKFKEDGYTDVVIKTT